MLGSCCGTLPPLHLVTRVRFDPRIVSSAQYQCFVLGQHIQCSCWPSVPVLQRSSVPLSHYPSVFLSRFSLITSSELHFCATSPRFFSRFFAFRRGPCRTNGRIIIHYPHVFSIASLTHRRLSMPELHLSRAFHSSSVTTSSSAVCLQPYHSHYPSYPPTLAFCRRRNPWEIRAASPRRF